MASESGSITTNEVEGRSLTLNWSKVSHDVGTNKTRISYSIVGSGSLSEYYYVMAGPITVTINGTTVYSTDADHRVAVYKQTLKSDTIEIPHNDDGSKTFSASISAAIYLFSVNASASGSWELPTIPRYATCNQSLATKTVNSIKINWSSDSTIDYVEYSKDGGTNWVAVGSVEATSGNYTISGLTPNTPYSIKTRVKRKDSQLKTESSALSVTTYDIAKITGSANWFIGNNTTVSYTNPSGTTIAIGIFNTAGSVAYASYRTPTASPYTFNFTSAENTALYNSIPDDPSGTVRIYLRTTANGTSYYDHVDRTITANQSINKPTFSNFTYADVNTNVTTLTGNNQILVNGLSNVTVTIPVANKAVAKNGASMDYYRITIGTKSTTVAYSSNADVSATINAVDSANISVEAVDTRGFGTIITKTATWKDYWKPTIETSTIERENGVGTKVFFNIAGKYWNDTFGSVTNRFKNLYFRYKTKSASSYSSMITITDFISYSNGNYTTISGSFLPTTHNGTTPIEFTVGIEYNIQFFVVDMTEGLTSGYVTLTLNSGIPCADKYKDSNGNYHIGINQLADSNWNLITGTIKATQQIQSNGRVQGTVIEATAMQQLYSSTNLDNVKDFNQVYYCNACTNMPTAENGHLRVQKVTDDYVVQEFTGVSTGYKYSRICYNGTWGAWRQIDNILGYGSNANGSYLQFSDGTMICWYSYRVTASNSNFATAYGSIYHNGYTTWTFPVKFTGVPKIIATAYLNGGIGGFSITTVPNDTAISGYEYSFVKYDFGAGEAGVDFVAIGRWK